MRFAVTVGAATVVATLFLCILFVADHKDSSAITWDEAMIVQGMLDDAPELFPLLEQCLDDGVITRREYGEIRREYWRLRKFGPLIWRVAPPPSWSPC